MKSKIKIVILRSPLSRQVDLFLSCRRIKFFEAALLLSVEVHIKILMSLDMRIYRTGDGNEIKYPLLIIDL